MYVCMGVVLGIVFVALRMVIAVGWKLFFYLFVLDLIGPYRPPDGTGSIMDVAASSDLMQRHKWLKCTL